MNNLDQEKCEENPEKLNDDQIKAMLEKVQGWVLTSNKELQKEFNFEDFSQVLDFVNKVGSLAEEDQHHPDMFIHDYKKLTISLSTHSVDGLSRNDFILAAKINNIDL